MRWLAECSNGLFAHILELLVSDGNNDGVVLGIGNPTA